MTTIEQHSQFQINSTGNSNLSPAIEKCLDNIIREEGFLKHTKYERAVTTNGGNYLGDLFEVDIKGKTQDGDKETNLFVKRIISGEGLNMVSTSDLQDREIMAYGEIYTTCVKLMEEANVPEGERFRQAKCYGANSEALIFENLSVQGYRTIDRTEAITYEYAKLAIKQLAKFHGLAFTLEIKMPEYFESKLKTLKHPMNSEHEDFKKVVKDAINICSGLIDKKEAYKLKAATDKIVKYKTYFADKGSKGCLCHGDYRTNNMLIKEKDGVITDLVPVDFQCIYFGNPMNDFLYFLIAHTDQEFRQKHLQSLKDLYHKTLGDFLKYFDINVDEVYPRTAMEQDYEERLGFGLLNAVVLFQFLFPSNDSIPDVTDLTSFGKQLEESAKTRMQGIVDDYIKWGFL